MSDPYRTILSTVLVLCSLPVIGCVSRPQRVEHRPPERRIEQRKPVSMTIDQVLRWEEAGTPDSEIIDRIETTHSVFDLDVEKILILREAGVSDQVINVMLRRSSPTPPGSL